MEPDFEWSPELTHRKGAATRLDGIDVLYDFEWSAVFPDGRAQFRNGQCLARQVRKDCPEGKTPVLLLTTREDITKKSFESESLYVVAINLRHYLEVASADAAVSFFASGFGSGVTRMDQLDELTDLSAEDIGTILELELNAERIAHWAAGDTERMEDLRRITGANETGIAGSP